MGLLNFTNCTLLVFFLYVSFTGKSFYDIFFPVECTSSKPNNKECIFSIPNWQQEFSVTNPPLFIIYFAKCNLSFCFFFCCKLAVCIPASRKVPSMSSDCTQFIKFSEYNLKEPFTKYTNFPHQI